MHYEQTSPQARANLAAIELKLAELDDLFLRFCRQHDYIFSRSLTLFPKRRVWRRQEIDGCMDLVPAVGFQEALDHGFYPEMPWSLYAQGSLHPGADPDVHLLSRPILEAVPFSRLASVLEGALARGLQILNAMTQNEILGQGLTARELFIQGEAERETYHRTQEFARNAEQGGST